MNWRYVSGMLVIGWLPSPINRLAEGDPWGFVHMAMSVGIALAVGRFGAPPTQTEGGE